MGPANNYGFGDNNRSGRANGANVGDVRDGYQWTGVTWEPQGGGGGGGGGGGAQTPKSPFTTDWWAKTRTDIKATLDTYYQQKLDLAKGDVELAKKYIESDYQNGLRYATDTYGNEVKYNKETGAANLSGDTLSATDETRTAQGEGNKAGVMVGQMTPGQTGSAAPTSDYYNQYIGQPLSDRQQLRRQAIQRAIDKQQSTLDTGYASDVGTSTATAADPNSKLGITRNTALNKEDTSYRNTALDLPQQETTDVTNQAQNKFTADYAAWQSAQSAS